MAGTQLGPQIGLGGFVADGSPHFIHEFGRNFGHAVIVTSMIGALSQNVLLRFTSGHKVAIHTDVSAAHHFCHVCLLICPTSDSSPGYLVTATTNARQESGMSKLVQRTPFSIQ